MVSVHKRGLSFSYNHEKNPEKYFIIIPDGYSFVSQGSQNLFFTRPTPFSFFWNASVAAIEKRWVKIPRCPATVMVTNATER